MSVQDNKEELKDLVVQCLKTKGVLGKIQAELRASVFLALEDQEVFKDKYPITNSKLKEYLKTEEGTLAICLVKEFLEFFNLQFTSVVFDPETLSGVDYKYEGRSYLLKNLKMQEDDQSPVIARLLRAFAGEGPPGPKENDVSSRNGHSVDNGEVDDFHVEQNGRAIIEKAANNIKASQQNTLSSLGSLPPLGAPKTDKEIPSDLKSFLSFEKGESPYADDFIPDVSDKTPKESKVDSGGESEVEEDISTASTNSPQAETADVSISKSSGQGDYEENL